jgi:hypothetical protein
MVEVGLEETVFDREVVKVVDKIVDPAFLLVLVRLAETVVETELVTDPVLIEPAVEKVKLVVIGDENIKFKTMFVLIVKLLP